ncbi:hypothetical protein HWV62_31635 [Athelia sp. TMB]|nr:hypothetical protein HWV62_31635 [Athelia sp. TMB]
MREDDAINDIMGPEARSCGSPVSHNVNVPTNMSRLPRLHSSPLSKSSENNIPGMPPGPTLKRKAAQDIDDELEATDQPRKLPAIGNTRPIAGQPLREIRTRTNSVSKLGVGPPPLTKPRAPAAGRPTISSKFARATSAPPKSNVTVRSVSATLARPGMRVASGSGVKAPDDYRFAALQNQVSSIESARAADAAALAASMEAERTKVAELQANHMALSKELASAKTHELTQRRELVSASDEIENLRKKHRGEIMDLEMDLKKREREGRELNEEVRLLRGDLERERESVSALKTTLSQQTSAHLTLSTQNALLNSQIAALQGSLDVGSSSISNLRLELDSANARIAELESEAREAEGIRRRLHNQVQELKGNIRVFCRVRPVLEEGEERAEMTFPDRRDHREIVLSSSSESAMGQERKEVYNFGFDRVFEPHSTQAEVFEEVSQLAQSCTDGYNVCIFAYGQTGSGKSFTMEGGNTEETMGMIPRAVEQVFRSTEELRPKGWEYLMEGQFLEIYNETINDLLGKHDLDDTKKHEIKHDPKTLRTTVTNATVLPLSSPAQVRTLLLQAQSKRSVAATLMNERSSRSHSVFTLRITGENKDTGERCAGSLNLVDLAGSERLEKSGAGSDKDRLKETQNINKSLSALGDVIAALGEKGEKGDKDKHIPYRNSRLTYLLQNSLSGNSKTLMVLNLSPLAAHLNESLTSLRFATKVNTTTIGTAKKARLASS